MQNVDLFSFTITILKVLQNVHTNSINLPWWSLRIVALDFPCKIK